MPSRSRNTRAGLTGRRSQHPPRRVEHRRRRRRRACSDDRAGTRAACTDGTRPDASGPRLRDAVAAGGTRRARSLVGRTEDAVTRDAERRQPRCIAPESFVTSVRQRVSTPASVGRSVRPTRFDAAGDAAAPEQRASTAAARRRVGRRCRPCTVATPSPASARASSREVIPAASVSRRRTPRRARARPAASRRPSPRPPAESAPPRRALLPARSSARRRPDRSGNPSARTSCR